MTQFSNHKQLVFVIYSLNPGGAERVVSTMANYWVDNGFNVSILTLQSYPPYYTLDSRVNWIPLYLGDISNNVFSGLYNTQKRVRCLRRVIQKLAPDVVISFTSTINILTLLATRGFSCQVMVSERVHFASMSIGRMWEGLRKWLYPRADVIVVQTERIKQDCPMQWKDRIRVIPNPLSKLEFTNNETFVKPYMLAVGRLERQKGYDLLIRAYRKLLIEIPDLMPLYILGEGTERDRLEELLDDLDLFDQVYLPGLYNPIHDFMRDADMFILSSRFEGFPNALCEAMACGCAVIATDCPTGPAEIIRHEVDGLLVETENIESMCNAIKRLVQDEGLRKQLAMHAPEVQDRFAIETVMRQWESLFDI